MASALDHPTNSQMRDKKNKTSLELLDSKVEKLSAKVEQLLAAQGTDRSHKVSNDAAQLSSACTTSMFFLGCPKKTRGR